MKLVTVSSFCPFTLISVLMPLQHQQDFYHVFIDFKKAFDMVWHAALQATMKKHNISTNLIQVIKNLYQSMTRPLMPSSTTAT